MFTNPLPVDSVSLYLMAVGRAPWMRAILYCNSTTKFGAVLFTHQSRKTKFENRNSLTVV